MQLKKKDSINISMTFKALSLVMCGMYKNKQQQWSCGKAVQQIMINTNRNLTTGSHPLWSSVVSSDCIKQTTKRRSSRQNSSARFLQNRHLLRISSTLSTGKLCVLNGFNCERTCQHPATAGVGMMSFLFW